MPKRVDPDARREQIAEAVIDEIAEHGLRAVTLARIAARTGFAIGSIRHYFGDNLREVMRFTLAALMQRLREHVSGMPDDPFERLVHVVTLAAPTDDVQRRDSVALVEYRLMARTDPVFAADVADTSLAGIEAARSLLRDALAGRAVGEEDLEREALLFFAIIEGLAFSSAVLPSPLSEDEVRTIVANTLQRVIDAYPPLAET